jgi:hypothetical protein
MGIRELSSENYARRIAVGCLAFAMVVVMTSAARAAGAKIAQVKTVSGQTFIVRDGVKTPVKIGDAVFEKDVIQTGADGAIGITFIDNTTLSAGPNSEVAMEEYKFDSSNFTGSMLTDMRKGTLSVVSGDIARSTPGAMKVRTPDAILGVRGTRFVVQVNGG